jgi:hypothetical protein
MRAAPTGWAHEGGLPACGAGHYRRELAGYRLKQGLVDLVGVGG